MSWLRLVYEHTLGPAQPLWINNGSNLTVFGLFATLLGALKARNCRQKGCLRIGFHKVQGTKFSTCHKHATVEIHDRLHAEHALKHPELHELLNRQAPSTNSRVRKSTIQSN